MADSGSGQRLIAAKAACVEESHGAQTRPSRHHCIGCRSISAQNTRLIAVYVPWTIRPRGVWLQSVVVSHFFDGAQLIDRAGDAFAHVARLSLDERLQRVAVSRAALEAAAPMIVAEAVRETGQTAGFAAREVQSALALMDALPKLAEPLRPQMVPSVSGTTMLEWAPYGVIFGWHAANSPVWVPTVVAMSALVAGNSVVCRPSRRAAGTSRLVLETLMGPWPVHALQIVGTVPPEVAEDLITHPRVGAVVAHGSTATCRRHMMRLAQAYQKGVPFRPYIPEASGNDPAIVLRGADLDRAANAIAIGAFTNAGQLCMAAKRIIVETQLWEEFAPRLRDAVESLVVGDPIRPQTDVAPMGERSGVGRARTALAEAIALGGQIVAGRGEEGPFFTPTVVLLPRAAHGTILWREESFAPLRGLMLAADPEDALALANADAHGLGATVFGDGEAIIGRLRAARVVVNEDPLYQDPHFVVGGVGDSGLYGARPKVEQLVYARRVHRAE